MDDTSHTSQRQLPLLPPPTPPPAPAPALVELPPLPTAWDDPYWRPTLAYIEALTGQNEHPEDAPLCVQTFDDDSRPGHKKDPAKARTLHGTFRGLLPKLVNANQHGAGIFVTVNNVTAGKPRTKANIPEARAWWVDVDVDKWSAEKRAAFNLDRFIEDLPLPPTMVVETKNGLHAYWTANESVTPEACEQGNRAIVARVDGDPAAVDYARVLRPPGFFHLKNPAAPFLVKFCGGLPVTRTLAEMNAAFPAPAPAAAPHAKAPTPAADFFKGTAAAAAPDELRQTKDRARAYLKKVPPAVSGEKGHTATLLACEHITRGFDLGLEDALEVMADWNRRCEPPWSEEELRRKVMEAREKGTAIPMGKHLDRRPRIVVTYDMGKVVDAALEALKNEPELYQQAHRLVHVRRVVGQPQDPQKVTRFHGAPCIAEVSPARLREMASVHGNWRKPKKDGAEAPAMPPDWLASTIMGRETWPFRPLQGIIETPALRPDGTVLDTPGYDPATGLQYLPDGATAFPAVPSQPTKADAEDALRLFADVLHDFPFDKNHHKAAAIAAILTPLVRPAIAGPCPLFLIDAPTPASGKSLLADVIGIIATGRACAKSPQATNEEEERKRIMAVLMAGDRIMCVDNVTLPLGNASLEALLTSTEWSDRVLGTAARIQVPAATVWFATGNNVSLATDMPRRVIPIRLTPREEHPESRSGFKHANLLEWVRANRGALVVAGLTLVRAFVVAGRPINALPEFGSFEAWSDLVRAGIVWAGAEDCNAGRAALQTSDPRLEAFRFVLQAWWDAFGERPATIHEALGKPSLAAALTELDPPVPEKQVEPRKLGMTFRKMKDRVFDGLRLTPSGNTGKHGQPWRVEKLSGSGHQPAGGAQ